MKVCGSNHHSSNGSTVDTRSFGVCPGADSGEGLESDSSGGLVSGMEGDTGGDVTSVAAEGDGLAGAVHEPNSNTNINKVTMKGFTSSIYQ